MNKRRLVIGGLGLITALGISSLSMSLAWYSSGTRLMVSSMDIQFIGAKDIKLGVSPDGEFKEALDKELNQIESGIKADIQNIENANGDTLRKCDDLIKVKNERKIFILFKGSRRRK